jgi:CO/xanthine dehydrogenase FAD-binding subunit
VKPAPFRYRRPETLEAALDALAHEPGARVLAGGQSLVPLMNQRRERPATVVDITRLEGLGDVEAADGRLRVGALVTQAAFERAPGVAARCPLAFECLPFTGHLATRNRGTVGGSIAHADPRAELPLALLTLGGTAEVASARGRRRTIAAEDLFTGPYENALVDSEILVATEWPTTDELPGQAFEEVAQRHGDYTIAAAACALQLDGDGRVAVARVGVGAVADRPLLVPEAAAALAGAAIDAAVADAAGRAAAAAIDTPLEDIHGSARYRRRLVEVLVARTARRAFDRAREAAA